MTMNLTRDNVIMAGKLLEVLRNRDRVLCVYYPPGLVELMEHLGYRTEFNANRVLVVHSDGEEHEQDYFSRH